MPYVNKPRPYKKEYVQQKKRGKDEQERRNARERARYAMDKTGVDKNKIDGQVDCYLSKMIQQDKINIYSTKTHFVSSNSTDTNIQTILKPIKGVDPYDYNGYKI